MATVRDAQKAPKNRTSAPAKATKLSSASEDELDPNESDDDGSNSDNADDPAPSVAISAVCVLSRRFGLVADYIPDQEFCQGFKVGLANLLTAAIQRGGGVQQ